MTFIVLYNCKVETEFYCIDYSINTVLLYSKIFFSLFIAKFYYFNQKNCFLSAESESLVLYQGINESLYLFLWSQIGIIVFDEHELILHVNQGLTLSTASLVFVFIHLKRMNNSWKIPENSTKSGLIWSWKHKQLNIIKV